MGKRQHNTANNFPLLPYMVSSDRYSIDGDVSNPSVQGRRRISLFHCLLPLLHLRLRQNDFQTPKIPQKSNSHGDPTSRRRHALDRRPHNAFLLCRSSWILQALRFPRRWSRSLVRLAPISALSNLYRLLHLLHPPRSTPPIGLQINAQSTPQMDHADALRICGFPPC